MEPHLGFQAGPITGTTLDPVIAISRVAPGSRLMATGFFSRYFESFSLNESHISYKQDINRIVSIVITRVFYDVLSVTLTMDIAF